MTIFAIPARMETFIEEYGKFTKTVYFFTIWIIIVKQLFDFLCGYFKTNTFNTDLLIVISETFIENERKHKRGILIFFGVKTLS